jgi:hypothetical protein
MLVQLSIPFLYIFSVGTFQENYGGYMVAFAGRKYAARSLPAFVANNTYSVTSFTLVREDAGPIMILIYLHKIFRNPLKFCNAGA